MQLSQAFKNPLLPWRILSFIEKADYPTISSASLSLQESRNNVKWYVGKLADNGFLKKTQIGNTMLLELTENGKLELNELKGVDANELRAILGKKGKNHHK